MGRTIYLDMKTRKEALKIMFEKLKPEKKNKETIKITEAADRILAEPVYAKTSVPSGHISAMDGIAVNAEETFGASETSPKNLISGENAFLLNTGNSLPKNCNAVIMIEDIQIEGTSITIEAPAFPWQNIRKAGEDIVATELLFPRGHKITPYCIGALIAAGIFLVEVVKKPLILIIPTGNEVKEWKNNNIENCCPGEFYDSNSYMLGAIAKKTGADYVRHPIVIDDIEKIGEAITDAASKAIYDAVLIIGGSSSGSRDFAKKVIEKHGEVYVHGVAIMPGKPFLFGSVKNMPVFGIPGYPVSAIIAFEQFVTPFLEKIGGMDQAQEETIGVECGKKINSRAGIEEFLRVKIGKVGSKIIATPISGGAGTITSITEANGIIQIPASAEGINAGEKVSARLISPVSAIENSIVIIGSHDNTLDLISDHLGAADPGNKVSLSSTHTGSLGGLMALKKGICHLAGSHLLDSATGEYNISWIKKYLKGKPVKLINLVLREQGLIVPKGNPDNIKSLQDIVQKNIPFINRQAGSGTRILLDYKLKEFDIPRENINGYENDEYTHMSVAVAVLSGTARAGLGIYAAAKALDLDFIPVVTEQYDLVIDELYFNDWKIQKMLEIINTDDFKQNVQILGGYNTKKTGTIIEIQNN